MWLRSFLWEQPGWVTNREVLTWERATCAVDICDDGKNPLDLVAGGSNLSNVGVFIRPLLQQGNLCGGGTVSSRHRLSLTLRQRGPG